MIKRSIYSSTLLGITLLPGIAHGTQIGVEEFVYTAGQNLSGQNGGTGFFPNPWSASHDTITSPSLSNPAVVSTAGNKATASTSSPSGSRDFNALALFQIGFALGTDSGLWYRYLHNVATSSSSVFTLLLGGNSQQSHGIAVTKNSSGGTPQYFVQIGTATSMAESVTSPLSAVDLVIVNVKRSDFENAPTDFEVKVWTLGQSSTCFDPTSTPLIDTSGTLNGYNTSQASIAFSDTANLDEIYFADTYEDLNVKICPEPATCASLLIGGGAFFIRRKRKKQTIQ